MKIAKLKKMGSSVVMEVPAEYIKELGLKAGSQVGVHVDGDRLSITKPAPDYTLDELLEGTPSDISDKMKDATWLNSQSEGRETL